MSWTSNNLSRNLLLFQAYSFFREIDFTRAVFVVYLLGLGVSNWEIGLLQTVLFLSITFWEVPSGFLADKYKRKWVMGAGAILMAVSFAAFFYAGNNIYYLMPVFIVMGVAFALNSGSDAALLYDGLVETGREKLHLKVMGQNRSLSTMALCFSVAAGGFLLSWSAGAVFALTSICALVSFGLVMSMPESSRARSESVGGEYKKFFNTHEGKKLFRFILLLALIEAIYTPMFIFAQSLFKEQGLSTGMISLVVAAAFLIEAASFRFVDKLERVKTAKVVYATLAIMGLSLLSISVFQNIGVSIAMFFLYNTIPAMLFAKTDDYIQGQAKSEIRASLTSTQSLVSSCGIGAGYLLFGLGFDTLGSAVSLGLVALSIVAIGAAFFFYFNQEEANVLKVA